MSNFDSGVKGYIYGTAVVRVAFPVDWNDVPHISCSHCPFYGPATRKCHLNGEIVGFPEKYVGDKCPLEETEEGEK